LTGLFTARASRPLELLDIADAFPDRYPYLLDSAARGPLGAHSLLLRTTGETLTLLEDGSLTGPGRGRGFLDRFDAWFRAMSHPGGQVPRLPFIGGWFVYLGYEFAGEIEPVLDLPAAGGLLPVALAARCDGAVIIDHARPGSGATLAAESEATLRAMQEELSGMDFRPGPERVPPTRVRVDPAADFETSVGRIHQYLRDGDVFQVNLSRGWTGEFADRPNATALYRSLRRHNPAPFAGMMRWGDRVVLSSSPERLVEVRGDVVRTRPIAGTYPRGRDAESDRAQSRDLLAHPKERAEHIMLIDLERNDLGRVCRPGTVEVDELMVVESYAHVHHMVSGVRGRLRPGMTPADIIRAVFPGGTITGCPKIRCMEIIAELEGRGRGCYTGSMGYVGRNGDLDLNILIRSMLLHGREVYFRTGAGIVADSEAAREVAETEAKARGLINALECGNA
jgi:anthranilate synthase component 1